MLGDKVIGLYFPGLVRTDYRRAAANGAFDLLRAAGHGSAEGPWLTLGVGVHAGKAFVGSLGVEGGSYEFAVLGDAMNVGARMANVARGREILISDAVRPQVADETRGEERTLELKGVAQPCTCTWRACAIDVVMRKKAHTCDYAILTQNRATNTRALGQV
jgi:adenylate cyclase